MEAKKDEGIIATNVGLFAINELIKELKTENLAPTPERFSMLYAEALKTAGAIVSNDASIVIDRRVKSTADLLQAAIQGARAVSDSARTARVAIESKDIPLLEEQEERMRKMEIEMQELKRRVFLDDLTGAFNRAWMSDNILEENTMKASGTIAFIDMNDFKEINDKYGHGAGDNALRFVVQETKRVLSSCGEDENIIRYGGDEFIVVFRGGLDKDDVLSIMNKVKEQVASKTLAVRNASDVSFAVDFSYGVSQFSVGQNFDEVSHLADKDMYANKINDKMSAVGTVGGFYDLATSDSAVDFIRSQQP